MATGTKTDFVINNEIASYAYMEKLTQNVEAFNGASNGTILLTTESLIGDFEVEDFFAQFADGTLSKDRDPSSTSSITPEKMSQISKINPKVNKYSYISMTLDSFKKKGWTGDTFSMLAGEAAAEHSIREKLNTLIASGMGAIQSEATMVDGDGLSEIAYADFPALFAKFEDQVGSVELFVMTSGAYYALMGTAIAEKLMNVAGYTINKGANPTFGIPVLVTNSPQLAMTEGNAIMALTKGALVGVDSEVVSSAGGIVRGQENLIIESQTEYAYSIRVKGYSYTAVTISPSAAVLGTDTSWTSVAALQNTCGAIFNGIS